MITRQKVDHRLSLIILDNIRDSVHALDALRNTLPTQIFPVDGQRLQLRILGSKAENRCIDRSDDQQSELHNHQVHDRVREGEQAAGEAWFRQRRPYFITAP